MCYLQWIYDFQSHIFEIERSLMVMVYTLKKKKIVKAFLGTGSGPDRDVPTTPIDGFYYSYRKNPITYVR